VEKEENPKMCKEVFRCGGSDPQTLLVPREQMIKMALKPHGFALAIPLSPHHNFAPEELTKLEENFGGRRVNRELNDPAVVWMTSGKDEETLWKKQTTVWITPNFKTPLMIGGVGSLWPIPLLRQGPGSNKMWRATFPEGYDSSWLDGLAETMTKKLKGTFWAISRRLEKKNSREWYLMIAAEVDWDGWDPTLTFRFTMGETKQKVEWSIVKICGFCIKTWPKQEVAHVASDCNRLKTINKFRGKLPQVTIDEEGWIEWATKEPTPDPEEAKAAALSQLNKKMDLVLKQQGQILEGLAKMQDKEKPKAEGSKAPKKKPTKAKDGKE